MAYDDRYGDDDGWRSRDRNREQGQWRGERQDGSGDWQQERDRGYGRDPYDRDPGAHVDYYRGGDRGQQRFGPEGGFEMRSDYRRSERHAEQGQSRSRDRYADTGSSGIDQDMGSYGNYGGDDAGVGYAGGNVGGVGFDPDFAGGPRFDRQDVGSTGTHGVHPVSSPYGSRQDGGFGGGSSAREQAILDQANQSQGRSNDRFGHDPHYADWRQRQIAALDRDYDEYRQENASRFESEFGSWREKRGAQRTSMGRVTEHMEVVGSDDQHVGTVDKVKDGRIILTKSDSSAGGHHHSIPCSWLDRVEDKVCLNKTAEEAMQAWRDEESSRALFERQDRGSDGPHILERSFSGTYRDER